MFSSLWHACADAAVFGTPGTYGQIGRGDHDASSVTEATNGPRPELLCKLSRFIVAVLIQYVAKIRKDSRQPRP